LCTPLAAAAGCFPAGAALCNANEKYTRNRMRMRQVALQSQRQKHKGKTISGKTIILIVLPKMVLPSKTFCFLHRFTGSRTAPPAKSLLMISCMRKGKFGWANAKPGGKRRKAFTQSRKVAKAPQRKTF
jgi:hypothetical protein